MLALQIREEIPVSRSTGPHQRSTIFAIGMEIVENSMSSTNFSASFGV